MYVCSSMSRTTVTTTTTTTSTTTSCDEIPLTLAIESSWTNTKVDDSDNSSTRQSKNVSDLLSKCDK